MVIYKIYINNNILNQLSKFRSTNCVTINEDSRRTYETTSQISLKLHLCHYKQVYVITMMHADLLKRPALLLEQK